MPQDEQAKAILRLRCSWVRRINVRNDEELEEAKAVLRLRCSWVRRIIVRNDEEGKAVLRLRCSVMLLSSSIASSLLPVLFAID